MQALEQRPEVAAYLDRICAQVKAAEVHPEIRLELLSHLEELVEERAARGGLSEEEIVAEALRAMGDADKVGRQLHAAHKPKPEWGLIALVSLLIAIGLLSQFAIRLPADGIIDRRLAYGFAGIAAMVALYFVDYRKLERGSPWIFGGTLLTMIGALWFSPTINGAALWLSVGPYNVNVFAASPYLLLFGAAGLLRRERPASGRRRLEKSARLVQAIGLYALAPALLYAAAPAITDLLVYFCGLFVLLFVYGKKKLLLGILSASVVLSLPVLYLLASGNRWKSLIAFLNPEAYADSFGYTTLLSQKAIQSGGLWGRGFGMLPDGLPFSSGELYYAYLVSNLGWVFGAAVVLTALLFAARLAFMAARLRDGYARGLVAGLSAVLCFQLIGNLLMCIGLLPFVEIKLPILNWSSGTILELATVGLILGAYRRKDMSGSTSFSHASRV